MQILATVENDTIKLPPGVHLPDGTAARVEADPAPVVDAGWPAGYFERTAGALTGEEFERPSQGLPRPVGLCAGEFIVPADFDDPLPPDILDAFEGR